MGERPFHRKEKAGSGLSIQAIRQKLASRFGPLPATSPAAPPAGQPGTDRRGRTLRPRSIGGTESPEPVPAGMTLLARLNSLLDASRRLRQSTALAAERPDVAEAARACVEEVKERVAALRDVIDISGGQSGMDEKAIRDMLDAQRELADAQDVLIRAQRELIAAGHAVIDRESGRPHAAGEPRPGEETPPGKRLQG